MTDKEIMIDGVRLEDIKNLLYTGQKMAISTKTFEAIIEQLQRKFQECEELKKYKDVVNKLAGMQIILTNKDKMPELYENAKDLRIDRYKQALEKIKDIVTQITFTVAGGEESPKWEWIRLYRSIVWEISKIINEVKVD